jgi:hypothetical protein
MYKLITTKGKEKETTTMKYSLAIETCTSNANFDLKTALQCCTFESSSLKIHAFLSFKMHQHIVIMISIAYGRPIWCLIYVMALVALNQDGISTLIEAQQFLANGHERKRCLKLSSLYNKHNSQTKNSESCLFFSAYIWYSAYSATVTRKRLSALTDTLISKST